MKITLNNKEEIELSEREKKIWSDGNRSGFTVGFFTGILGGILIGFIIACLTSCTAPQQFTTVQQFKANKPISAAFHVPDTITLIHHYKWSNGHIVAVQDMKKDSLGKWVSYGDWYAAPDSLDNVVINGFVK